MENINEKISWKTVLLYLGLGYSVGKVISTYKDYSKLKQFYTVVNSPSSEPSKREKQKIDSIRYKLIEEVRSSKLFNKFNKQYILDSLETIKFVIVDTISDVGIDPGKDAAFYINIDYYKKSIDIPQRLNKSITPNRDNFIIVVRNSLYDDDYSTVIMHEMYHYLDHLLGSKGSGSDKMYSYEIDVTKFFDKKIKDRKRGINKMAVIMTGSPIDSIKKYMKGNDSAEGDILIDIITKEYDTHVSRIDYFEDPNELFARFKTFKHDLVKDSIISNVNDPINDTTIAKYITRRSSKGHIEEDNYMSQDSNNALLLFLDFAKIEELDKLL